MTVTPYSYREYTGNGANRDFQVPFPYLLKAHVKVYTGLSLATGIYTSLLVDGVGYTWTSATNVQLTTPPAAGVRVTVKRETPTNDLLAQWQDGSTLVADDLLISDKQNLYAVQESSDTSQIVVQTAVAAADTANSVLAAVSSQLQYTLIANVAAIPAAPANGDYIEVADSTGVESFSPLSGKPSGFIGDAGLTVRMGYSTSTSSWFWLNYFPTNADSRYLKKAGGVMTGALLGDDSNSATAPGFSFDGDSDTGMYRPGANELALAVGGQAAVSIDASKNVTMAADGTVLGDLTVQGIVYGSLAGGVGVKLGIVLALS